MTTCEDRESYWSAPGNTLGCRQQKRGGLAVVWNGTDIQ